MRLWHTKRLRLWANFGTVIGVSLKIDHRTREFEVLLPMLLVYGEWS